ncbi:Sensor histidine kinase regulating citrate/malate metabolism [Klenkia soli]|uniref:histidine kinase n=1 Tax=Klenkia soli TaxID=1052260 RepID=A0A1H0GKA9_9ACTN|nr:ATP-binding protein [Klenkia soli]SDO07425.1 Sensor histidine kinase regulating citrate/malate metabolism [Klenkia soli]
MHPRRWSFTRQTLAVLVLLVVAVLVVAFGGSAWVLQRQVTDDAGRLALAIARSVAEDDVVRAGAEAASDAPAPSTDADRAALVDGAVQVAAEDARLRTGALFVVVTDDRGLRLAHPSPDRLGLLVSSDPSIPLAGGEVVEEDSGTLGEAARAKVPVRAPGSDRVVGEVSVGVAVAEVDRLARDAILLAAGTAVLALLGGVAGAVLLARRLRRLTHGVQPEELGGLLQGHEAVLRGIGDGVVAVGPDGRVVLANEEAVRLLGRPVARGDATDDWPAGLRSLVADPDPAPSLTVLGDRALLCSARRVSRDGRDLGVVLTLRDRTDVELLTRQLDAVAEAGTVLRAQRHEFANRLHLVSGLLDTGLTTEAADYVHELLGTGPLGAAVEGLDTVADPYLQAFLAAKAAHAREGGVQLRLGSVAVGRRLVDPVDVTTVLGNLVDNAVTALAGRPDGVAEVDLVEDGDALVVAVADNGPGVPPELGDRVFETGVTTRPSGEGGIGLGLVRQVARARGGSAVLGSAGGDGGLGGAVFVVRLPGVLEEET